LVAFAGVAAFRALAFPGDVFAAAAVFAALAGAGLPAPPLPPAVVIDGSSRVPVGPCWKLGSLLAAEGGHKKAPHAGGDAALPLMIASARPGKEQGRPGHAR
jgi:hypothetical protein